MSAVCEGENNHPQNPTKARRVNSFWSARNIGRIGQTLALALTLPLGVSSSSPVIAQENVPAYGSCSSLGSTSWKAELILQEKDNQTGSLTFPDEANNVKPPEPVQCHIHANRVVVLSELDPNTRNQSAVGTVGKNEDFYWNYPADQRITLRVDWPYSPYLINQLAPTSVFATPIPIQKGILASSISQAEQQAFFDGVRDMGNIVHKWTGPIHLQLGQSSYDQDFTMLDDLTQELGQIITTQPVNRVTSNGNIIVNFVFRSTMAEPLWGYAAYPPLPNDPSKTCRATVAEDPQSDLGQYRDRYSPQQTIDFKLAILRHEVGHCLGLGHNRDSASLMVPDFGKSKYLFNDYYLAGSRANRYPDFDRALIRTLYHNAVLNGMVIVDLQKLFEK